MSLELWLTFVVASILISISPGAGAINTMNSGLQFGVKQTLPAIFGLQLGYALQIGIVMVGLGALIASSAIAFEVIKWLGAGYLVWLGYKKWTQATVNYQDSMPSKESRQRQFWSAAFVNLTNPKATVFLVALFPQFIDPDQTDLMLQYLVMGSTLVAADTLVMLGYASLASRLSHWVKGERNQMIQNKVFGSLFVAVGALMASYRSS